MPSPSTDDYASLRAPWKPITEIAMRNITSAHKKIQADDGFKARLLAWTNSINAVNSFNDFTQRNDVERLDRHTVQTNIAIDDEVLVPTYIHNSGFANTNDLSIDNSISTEAALNQTDTDTDDEPSIDSKCVAVPTCLANSGDHRKVVSHIFGRNKKCTLELPNLWVHWCRKHYQRFKYRAEATGAWHLRQLDLVYYQLQIFEDWGKVRSWTIVLRKAEAVALAKMNHEAKMRKKGVIGINQTTQCWESFLLPYLGSNKTFAHVREVLEVIDRKFNEEDFKRRDNKLKMFPGVEFLPVIGKAKEPKKGAPATPATKSQSAYKKITLDQPAFNRKNRANKEYLEKVAREVEGSTTPKSSRTPSQKAKSPDTDTLSASPATLKRKASTPDIATITLTDRTRNSLDMTFTSKEIKRTSPTSIPISALLSEQHNNEPTKRRRLDHTYENHGSGSEGMIFMGKEEQGETGDENSP